jgi:hypothetical protein
MCAKNILIFTVLFAFISALYSCSSDEKYIDPYKIKYHELMKSNSEVDLDLDVITPRKYPEDTLAAISDRLKNEMVWEKKMVMWFHVQTVGNTPYATYSFLPKCNDCPKDNLGNKFRYHRIIH